MTEDDIEGSQPDPDPSCEERLKRKMDHLDLALTAPDGPLSPGFSDVHLIHRAAPVTDLPDIDLRTALWGRELSSPFFVDAMTGGPRMGGEVNAALAGAARAAGWGMAAGSQQIALQDDHCSETFAVIRQNHPSGWVAANLSAGVDPQHARRAVEMLSADALQLHLNAAQELLMPEGDREFAAILDSIRAVVDECSLPVMVKEVGFGISRDAARDLLDCGVHAINVAGAGGSNFAAIELSRADAAGHRPVQPADYLSWGIPTVPSLAETASAVRDSDVALIASGGVRSPLDAVKALVLGADMVSVAGPVWRVLRLQGEAGVRDYMRRWNEDVGRFLLLLGAGNVGDLSSLPYVITGDTAEYMRGRGHPTFRR